MKAEEAREIFYKRYEVIFESQLEKIRKFATDGCRVLYIEVPDHQQAKAIEYFTWLGYRLEFHHQHEGITEIKISF